ncbi:MAG: hypothetical protein JWQ21_514, partial [Herminiimonas sp.]|nr:hypothetical protein [Herminiimonas sp.]
MKNKTGILFYLLALAPLTVHAQKIFMCKDASGRTLTSDRPIPECADRAVREFDKNGIVRHDIAAPLTAEQKRQKQLEEEKRKADEAAAAEQKQNDRAIVARYRNEEDIAIARKRTVDLVQEQIKREAITLAAAEKRRKDLQAEAELPKNKKAAPPGLQRNLDEADQAVRDQKKKIQDYEAEAAQINGKFDATLKR